MTKRLPPVHSLDVATLVAGVVALVFSFRSYYTVSVAYVSDSTSAWHGFFGWFGTVLAVAGAVVVAVTIFVPQRRFPFPPRPVALALFGLGAVSTFAALYTSGYEERRRLPGAPVDTGHGYGYWVSLAAIVAGAVLTAARCAQLGWSEVWLRRPGGRLGFESGAAASAPPAPTDQRGELR